MTVFSSHRHVSFLLSQYLSLIHTNQAKLFKLCFPCMTEHRGKTAESAVFQVPSLCLSRSFLQATGTSLLLFSPSVMFNPLQPHGLQHARFPCPSLSLEIAQTHVDWVSDAMQPSHPLMPPSPPTLSLSQHQGLFQWVSSLHQVGKVLELQLQHQWFQWIFRVDVL